MSIDKTWTSSPTELMRVFRESLQALIPIANKIHMSWKEPNSHDDWDNIAAALFKSIVIGSIENSFSHNEVVSIIEYDKRSQSYNGISFISEEHLTPYHAFVCLETVAGPFDTCLFARLDSAVS